MRGSPTDPRKISDMSDRLAQLRQFLEEDPADPFLLFALAQEYASRDQHLDALQYYTRLLEAHPEYIATYYHLGKLYESMDNPENALRIYEKGMQVASDQNDPHALSELRGAYEHLKF